MLELYKIVHTAPTWNKLPYLQLTHSLYKHTIAEIPELFLPVPYPVSRSFVLLALVKTNLHVFVRRLANLYQN